MYFCAFSLLLFTGCSSSPQYIRDVNKVVAKKSNQLCKEENLSVVGTGGSMMNEITEIFVAFDAQRRVDISEARRLCVRCIEELRNKVNGTESLRDYLNPYPFPTEAMSIRISFVEEDGSHVSYGCAYLGTGGVSSVFQLNKHLYYSSYNPRTSHLEDYYDEPYDEALAIVQRELMEQTANCKP